MSNNRSEDEDALLEDTRQPAGPSVRKQSTTTAPLISDNSFQLITSYFDSKVSELKNELVSGNDSFARKLKEEVSVKLKGEGNQIQFSFNSEILADLQKLQKRISTDDYVSTNLISGLIVKVKKRNKSIRIADKSPAGWATVREYESDDLASDSEDEKRLRQAESRALKAIKEKKSRSKPYNKTTATVTRPIPAYQQDYNRFQHFQQLNYSTQQPFPRYRRREATPYDLCYGCNQYGHWRKNCPNLPVKAGNSGANGSK